MVLSRLKRLREQMALRHIDAYIVCTEDFHGSEYVGDYFKVREYFSGFTGSAGILVVTPLEAALWTDGRYFLQAEKELAESSIRLMRSGQPGVPKPEEYLKLQAGENMTVGFDGRTVSAAFVKRISDQLIHGNVTFSYEEDLADIVWQDRPAISTELVWELPVNYAGLSREEKLACVRTAMDEQGADFYVISALDNIAWLLNLRGNDVECNPVFLSYMIVGRQYAYLYIHEDILSEEIHSRLNQAGVMLRPYDAVYEDLQNVDFLARLGTKKADRNVLAGQDDQNTDGGSYGILVDERFLNYRILMSLSPNLRGINAFDPIQKMKAVKTKAECDNMKRAHVKDGVAVTRFIYWLKQNIGREKITELGAACKLEQFRREQEGYLGPSFAPIMAYAEHGAIVHYSATEESNGVLEPRSFLLADTGGHYLEGTTDITRTIPLGELTAEEKKAYTLVLAGHLLLANARFLYGLRGVQLDILAREPLWREGLDFNHGTGHGVGYLLNVHEGPNAFRYRMPEGTVDSVVLEEGMITSDEPGLYFGGKFGIRHENLILCRKAEQNAYGQFMCFENLTMVPFDWDAIDTDYMSNQEISLLNNYHAQVFATISPYLNEDEKKWLYGMTRERA